MTRRKELVEAGLCGNGLHPWVEGRRQCPECRRESNRVWRENNRDKERERDRVWRENNRDKERERVRVWRERNVERKRESNREWEENNRDRARERLRVWRENNPDKEREISNRRRARLAEASVAVILDRDVERILESPCAHAHLGECDGPMNLDHIIPLSRGGRHAIGNLQPLCRSHNSSKRDRLEIEVKAGRPRRRRREEVAA